MITMILRFASFPNTFFFPSLNFFLSLGILPQSLSLMNPSNCDDKSPSCYLAKLFLTSLHPRSMVGHLHVVHQFSVPTGYWGVHLVILLPARASEQGNVIGLVSVYIYIYSCHQKKL